MEARKIVAWNLRRLRVEKGISQDDLALEAGVERAYVGHLERATRNPTVDTLDKIATALGRPLRELFDDVPKGAQAIKPLRGGRKSSGLQRMKSRP